MSTKKQKQCAVCGKPRALTLYYSTNSKMFPDGKVPICKHCISEQVDENDVSTVRNILRQIDKPYIQMLWESAVQSEKDTFGTYMKNINSLPQYKTMTYDDSTENKTVAVEEKATKKSKIVSDFEVTDELIDKWGYGYEPEEYRLFERKYEKLNKNYGQKTALHTEGLISYIRFRVREELATAQGDVKEAKEWGALASKSATDAKLNVSQLSKSDISGGVDVVAQLFEAVENEVGVIPLLPKVVEQPYDDVDLVIWATINYNRRLEDKAPVAYRDIWNFYDEMLQEHFDSQGYSEKQIKEFKKKRNNVFRDLSQVYIEPLYSDEDESGDDDGESQELSE